jgi:hypothetical protein
MYESTLRLDLRAFGQSSNNSCVFGNAVLASRWKVLTHFVAPCNIASREVGLGRSRGAIRFECER